MLLTWQLTHWQSKHQCSLTLQAFEAFASKKKSNPALEEDKLYCIQNLLSKKCLISEGFAETLSSLGMMKARQLLIS